MVEPSTAFRLVSRYALHLYLRVPRSAFYRRISNGDRIVRTRVGAGLVFAAAMLVAARVGAQQTSGFGTCVPRNQRTANAVGCFIIVDQPVGALGSGKAFWHISSFPNMIAAMRARPARAAMVDAYGRYWVMEIDGSQNRKGPAEVATIGPMPITPGASYSAMYMEASMTPGMKSSIHRHSGPEAWYTLSGETCLETPGGTTVGRAGGPPVIIPGGPPMELTATGEQMRQSLVLILHDAHQPPTSMERQWKPRGLCSARESTTRDSLDTSRRGSSHQENFLMQTDRDFAAATHARGIEGWMSFFAPDAIRIRYRGDMVKGFDAIRRFDMPTISDSTATLNWEPTDAYLFRDGNTGSTTGKYWVVSRRRGDRGKQLGHGRYVTMWRRDGGRWLVIMDTGYPEPDERTGRRP
jgi:ketosteroid isomerase-like protein/quercetin dioxygenase-like cupin family protein